MTLQRIVGAGVLSFIFVIIAIILLYQNNKPIESDSLMVEDLTLLDMQAEEPVMEEVEEVISPEPEMVMHETELPIEEEPAPPVVEEMAVELTVPAPTVIETPEIKWFLQIASFSLQENAKQLILDLKQKDITAKADMAMGPKGQIYRVRTIPHTNKNQVEQTAGKIQQNFDITPQLLRRDID